MLHKTKGIVLRSIKYGETSLIVTIFTELFGIQTYMVNGIRTSKKASAKANYFQPIALLDLVVYHNNNKPLQHIKEFNWACLYNNLLTNVVKNSIASYMVELLSKCLKQPESNKNLFIFCEDALQKLDEATTTITANFALFFTLQLPHFFGFKLSDNYNEVNIFLDLQEGQFVKEQPTHNNFLLPPMAAITAQLLKVMQPNELENFKLNKMDRRKLLLKYQDYYTLHLPEFGVMKTLTILHEVL